MSAPAPTKVDTDASLKLLEDKLKRLEYKFSKQYIVVEDLRTSMVQLKDALAKSVSSAVEEEKYADLAAMVKLNTHNIQNLSSIVATALAANNKPAVQTSLSTQVEVQARPLQTKPGEECHMYHCFKLHVRATGRNNAEQTCRGEGGHLVMAKTRELYDFVVQMKNRHHRDAQFWFGARYTDDTDWVYPDGTSVADAVPWAQNEPNDQNNYHCSHIVFGAKDDDSRRDLVADADCYSRFIFVCERVVALTT
ncbi:PREDICTED: uncharacterized protein LOC109482275 [Branchiostoma belcheri]|uniref:Uncharacterized protein LOC109482275 n=1 Tax=Branchiostoma belcheri TaxID=7741 RepID=A0A6P4ZH49_BRABE|nr:PREDICTED: uncharacterized protein LOC109482275 [Branchiostoma belcheri]